MDTSEQHRYRLTPSEQHALAGKAPTPDAGADMAPYGAHPLGMRPKHQEPQFNLPSPPLIEPRLTMSRYGNILVIECSYSTCMYVYIM